MYWFKSNLNAAITLVSGLLLVACITACKPDIKETGAALKYFDIKGYFTGEVARLTRLSKQVTKTVAHNTITESKKVAIDNWSHELDLFTSSDINRPAWKNSYTVIANDGLLIYRAKFPELKMREMVIKTENAKVKWVLIFNKTKNLLYQTAEKLSYFPDSLYLIEKDQRVKLMGNNHYRIEGTFIR